MDQFRALMDKIRKAGNVFALTGAGVSTLCGIPDFRTDQSGVWDRFDRNRIFNIDVFMREPRCFYEFAREYIYTLGSITPGPAHFLLAELEKKGLLSAVATQNIDGLHQAAGSRTVFELHGHPRTSHCLSCGRAYNLEETGRRLEGHPWPACDCGGAIKPDVVFYGEQLPQHALSGSMQAAAACDLLLVLGTSLVVYPAAYIPQIALESGGELILMNKTPTPFDRSASLCIKGDLAEVCPKLLEMIRDLEP